MVTIARARTFRPASRGVCGVIACDEAAVVEEQRRTGPSTWHVALSCCDHAPVDAWHFAEAAAVYICGDECPSDHPR